VRGGRPDRTQYREIHPQPRRLRKLRGVVAGRGHQREIRPRRTGHEPGGGQVQAVGAAAPRQFRITVDQHPHAVAPAVPHGRAAEGFALRLRQRGLAQLYQPQPALQRGGEGRQLRGGAAFPGMGDRVDIGQAQRSQYRSIGRQHGSDARRVGLLPGERSMHMVAQFAAPRGDAEEMQPHMGVLIDVLTHEPGRRRQHLDFELLVQLAHQRLARRLAGFDLAAGKFPVAGVEGGGGALAEQKAAVRPQDDGGRDLGDLPHFCRPA
jgi:hypothetical protein